MLHASLQVVQELANYQYGSPSYVYSGIWWPYFTGGDNTAAMFKVRQF
jgi:hypothetical protein